MNVRQKILDFLVQKQKRKMEVVFKKGEQDELLWFDNLCRIARLFLIFVVCWLTVKVGLSTDYYVSISGSNTNSGSLEAPFRTIQYGVTKLQPGDMLYVRTGVYVETVFVGTSGTKEKPIKIMAYPGDSPIIDGMTQLPQDDYGNMVLLNGNYLYFSGFEVRNSNINGTHLGGTGVVLAGQHNEAHELNVHHAWENGILAMGDFSVVENCEVWQCAYSNSANPGSPASGYWSTGLSAARSRTDGITTNAILRGNLVYNNWGEGLSSFEAEGTLIEDNIVFDNWSVNLYVSDTRDAVVQRNIVYNTPNNLVGQRRPFTLGDELANKPRSANTIVINNLIYNADLWAFWSTAVPGSGLDHVLIANNTLVNGQLEIGASVGDQAHNTSGAILNNIFFHETEDPWEIKGSLENLTFSNNLWSKTPPEDLRGQGDVTGDPKLARTGATGAGELAADYFKLTKNSPAIDHGLPLALVPTDFFQHSKGSQPDIGGHEYNPPTGLFEYSDSMTTPDVYVIISHSRLTIFQNEQHAYEKMALFNMLGVEVLVENVANRIFSVDVSGLPAGTYIVLLSGKRGKKEIKVTIPTAGLGL